MAAVLAPSRYGLSGIRNTADLVQEITVVSDEQSRGSGQAGNAMDQLDKIALNTAASFHELAATAAQ